MSERSLDPDFLNKLVGKIETQTDTLDAKQANLMAATLGQSSDHGK